jgi:hypothetical protein
MELKVSLPCSQGQSTGPYPKSDQFFLHACYMFSFCYHPLLDESTYIRRKVQIMKLIIM